MAVTRSDVEHTAELARLDLSVLPEAEVEALTGQLNRILAFVALLSEVDTTGVTPISHPLELEAVLRADEPMPTPGAAAILSNAPARRGDLFLVPRVVEDGSDG